ncbi:hypothetical protein DPMN_101026 [Dreissena polymorpha]|uniref:Uncharacterized protein n=1 Tax=Dreissena polymorpha TaxID=45954 RepID=A0A9D4LJ75_DREPO|nr:hypothetical protein DPMN_101026 [Dreissena polymorpha]
MIAKLECRFGAKELPETSKAKFQQATQNQNESLEDSGQIETSPWQCQPFVTFQNNIVRKRLFQDSARDVWIKKQGNMRA